jgi:tetratricopeptide (TPR) repeat protein
MTLRLFAAAGLAAMAAWNTVGSASAQPGPQGCQSVVAIQTLKPSLGEPRTLRCRTGRRPAMLAATAAKSPFELCDAADTYNDIDNAYMLCDRALNSPGITAMQRARLLFKRGEALYWARRLDMALVDLDASIAIDGTSTEARLRRAWTNWQAQRKAPAFLEVTELLSLDDKNANVLFAYGYFNSDAPGQAGKAIAAYEQVLAINPDHYLARFNLAQERYFTQQDAVAGFAELEKLIAAGPEKVSKVRYWRDRTNGTYDFYGNARETRGLWYEYTRQSDKALKEYDWLATTYPKVASGFVGRARVRESFNDLPGALRDAERAIELDRWGDEQKQLRLRLLYAMKRPADIVAMATGIIEGGASDSLRGDAYFYRALVHRDRSENDPALDDFENSFRYERFYLRQRLQRMASRGYYEGKETDEYSEAARNGLRACILDPEC